MSVVMAVNSWCCWQKTEEQKRGELGEERAVYQLLPPPLGQQNLDRRRFDLLGNKDPDDNKYLFHTKSLEFTGVLNI